MSYSDREQIVEVLNEASTIQPIRNRSL